MASSLCRSLNLLPFSIVVISATFAAPLDLDNRFIEQELDRAKNEPDNRVTLEIEQPILLVFNGLLSRLAEYSDDVVTLQFDHDSSDTPGELGVGSQRISTMKNGDTLVQRIILYEAPFRFAYFTDMDSSTLNVPLDYTLGYYELYENDNQIVEAQVNVVYKPSSRFTAFLVKMGFNRSFIRDFRKAEKYLNSL